MKATIFSLFLLGSIVGYSQESYLKAFTEKERSPTIFYPICLYPSTLRMINLAQNEAYNEFVNSIDKVLIYNLDAGQLEGDYKGWMKDYLDIGYEEYISIFGVQTMRLIGKDDEYVGLVGDQERMVAFYLKGDLEAEKIPELIKTFQSNELLSIVGSQFD